MHHFIIRILGPPVRSLDSLEVGIAQVVDSLETLVNSRNRFLRLEGALLVRRQIAASPLCALLTLPVNDWILGERL